MTVDSVISAAVSRAADTASARSAVPSARPIAKSQSTPDAALIIQTVDKANSMTRQSDTSLHYQVHEASNVITVKVVNNDTGQVIREVPSEKFLDMMEKLEQLVGFIINEKV